MTFKQVHISELLPGSFVVQVLQQSGKVTVKHAGWVRTPAAIELLRQKGVQVVLIDPSRQLSPTIEPYAYDVTAETDAVDSSANSSADTILFADELPRAERLIQQSYQVQRLVLNSAKLNKKIDLSLVHEVSAGISDSIARNQDVLLFLLRMAEHSDALLQHSINCAIYIAAFARYLNLPVDKVQLLITTSLLHDIGKAVYPEPLQHADHLTIAHSLQLLQQHRQLNGVVSLWISQHCAHLDGSGHPRIFALHIDQGSRMLAIVNHYEKLTSPLQGQLIPLAASRQLLQQTPQQLDETLVHQFIKCIGVYPPGSVVKLTSGKLALVLENNATKPLLPKVKLFYHSAHQHHIQVKVLDLAKQQEEIIETGIDLKQYGLDIKHYL
jgi:hypothetical protein